MTTSRLSSPREFPATAERLLDSHGRPLTLGRQIGRGGEGSVHEVVELPGMVAKLYHQSPLPEDQVAKLAALVSRWSTDLEAISAWPRSLVYVRRGEKPCGILMPHVLDSRHLHELYGTTNRRLHFPEALWHHLVLAARNTAAAFHTLHMAGIVVGDVNQGNLMVDPQMCVRLIDCDSFQIISGDRTFACPVGTPHFTPPELQSQKLRGVCRTADHDAFGLAVLIFHLLFVGRHPFAGRYRGPGDLPIPKAIAERRFAFSRNRNATLVDPPPASLTLEDLPDGLARLFESAFCRDSSTGASRPRPLEWVGELERLLAERTTCSFDGLHVYYRPLRGCPWCRIEEEGGPAFFVPRDGISQVSTDRLAHLDRRIDELRPIRFPELAARGLELPQTLPLKRLAARPKWTWADAAAVSLAASAVLCLLGVVFWPVLWVATGMSLASGGVLLQNAESRARRKRVFDDLRRLDQLRPRIQKLANDIAAGHQKRSQAFGKVARELRTAIEHYRAKEDQLPDVLQQQCAAQKAAFLRSRLLRDHARAVPGLTLSLIAMLESFGIESAFDVDKLSLCAVPNISGSLTLELLQWRSALEAEFVFRPDHGITAHDLRVASEMAARRFKLSQARKVLMGAKQVESLAKAGELELTRALARYDAHVTQWRSIAGPLRDFQSARRPLERFVNRSEAMIVGSAAGIGLFGVLLWLLVR